MANRYANLVGSNKIKDEWQKINTGFDLVQADMDAKAGADDLVDLENTVNNHIGAGGNAHAVATDQQAGFMSAQDKQKLDGVEAGAQVNQNAFAKVNDVEAADPSDELTITGGTGITITTNPNTKEVIVTATGSSTPGPHGSSHTEHGADPIPTATTTEGGLMSADHVQMLESHAARHAAGGPDEITPEMIGAAPATHAIEHITGGSDVIPNATTSVSGLMSAADKAKLDAATSVATPNTIVMRDANGRFKAAAPSASDDVARKAEVDAIASDYQLSRKFRTTSIANEKRKLLSIALGTYQNIVFKLTVTMTEPTFFAFWEGLIVVRRETGDVTYEVREYTENKINNNGSTTMILKFYVDQSTRSAFVYIERGAWGAQGTNIQVAYQILGATNQPTIVFENELVTDYQGTEVTVITR